MSVSDDLVESDAERACLDELRKLVGAADGPIERHSVRVFLLAEELARRGGHTCDRELVPQWWRGAEVELIRRGDLVEVAHGLVRFGVPRSVVHALVARVPRDCFARAVIRAVVARERPRTLWRIFRP